MDYFDEIYEGNICIECEKYLGVDEYGSKGAVVCMECHHALTEQNTERMRDQYAQGG